MIEIKKLELKQNGSWLKRNLRNNHSIKTLIYAALGALVAYAYFYFGQDADNRVFWNKDTIVNVIIGIGFGIFITNSPCARGRC